MILVNPNQGGSRDLPNVALAYIAKAIDAPVMDLNTWVRPPAMVFEPVPDEALVSVPSRAREAARLLRVLGEARGVPVSAVQCPIRILCCYPYLFSGNTLDVALAPGPDYTRFDTYDVFAKHWADGSWSYPLFTSWGCPYTCTYCAAHRTGWRARSIRHVARELRTMPPAKVLSVIDDCFNHYTGHVLSVCKALKAHGREWMATNGLRADRLTQLQARTMADAGCTTVGFGVESTDPAVLERIRKGETIKQIERGVAIAKQHFPSVSAYLIVGLPGSSYDSDRRSLDWAIGQGVYATVSYFTTGDGAFYGAGAKPSAVYPAEQQEQAMQAARGLSWGSSPGAWGALLARWRLGRRAWPLLKMDAGKLWRRVTR